MKCYRDTCRRQDLPLAGLSPSEVKLYSAADMVLRVCADCGLEQNHYDDPADPEPLTPAQAVEQAPRKEIVP